MAPLTTNEGGPLRTLSLTATPDLLARLDAFRAHLAEKTPGVRPSRSCAARVALERGPK